jgi:hypothetical protein
VTPIAVIASTIFWTWLWGPLGLLLAMPITVCLAVLGHHVEGLEFFEVLLGDEPALTPEHLRSTARSLEREEVDEPVLCIGGRNVLDEAAADRLAEVLEKRGLDAKSLAPETLSAGHITSLANTQAKLIALSYLGLGTGPAHIRYLMRRLRRILLRVR